jgi:recombinational DNA repair protein RecR
VTRLAAGLPAGSGIMYTDSVTLARAIKGRQDL